MISETLGPLIFLQVHVSQPWKHTNSSQSQQPLKFACVQRIEFALSSLTTWLTSIPSTSQHLHQQCNGGWGGHWAPIRRGRVWGASTPCVDLDQPSLADQVTASVDLLDRLAATHQTCKNFQGMANWKNSVLFLYLFFCCGFCERKIDWIKDIFGSHKRFGNIFNLRSQYFLADNAWQR